MKENLEQIGLIPCKNCEVDSSFHRRETLFSLFHGSQPFKMSRKLRVTVLISGSGKLQSSSLHLIPRLLDSSLIISLYPVPIRFEPTSLTRRASYDSIDLLHHLCHLVSHRRLRINSSSQPFLSSLYPRRSVPPSEMEETTTELW